KETAGSKWFNLPATELTPEIERDLMLLKARNVLDPKRHYKKGTINEIPKYFQIGTIIAAPHEFYSSRIPKKDRKQHLIDELMADMESKKYYRKKFGEVMTK
ncbi:Fcf2 pre-rRNA processing, partial [Paraphysoderma sedebokerense]